MNEQVAAVEVYGKLKNMYRNLFIKEMELRKSIQVSNDDYDFTIHAGDNNSCIVKFNANERNNYTNPVLVLFENEAGKLSFLKDQSPIYIDNIKNIKDLYFHFKNFKELYKLMDSSYTINFDNNCRIVMGGHSFRISDEFDLFVLDYIDEKVTVYDNTVLYDKHLSFNFPKSNILQNIFQKSVDMEKLPNFLIEEFNNDKQEEELRQLEEILLEIGYSVEETRIITYGNSMEEIKEIISKHNNEETPKEIIKK